MAKVNKNIVIEGLSGSLGDQLVIQAGKGGTTIIRTKPQPSDKPPSEAQQQQRERFQEAVAYAKGAKEQAAYVEKAAGTEKSAYNPSTGSGQASRQPIGCIHPRWWKWISRPGQAA